MSIFIVALAVVIGVALIAHLVTQQRLAALQAYSFPDHIVSRVRATYPHLTDAQCGMVIEGLRQFFAISILARGRRVAMPSRAVDTAWHEFILSTRAYSQFCRTMIGRFLHHTPAEAMRSRRHAQEGIRRAWALCCGLEKIDPRAPERLPILFAIDAQLAIAGGFTYALNCGLVGSDYCAGHIGGCSGSGGDGDGDGGGCGGE